ncbi:ABC transporter ATP-binding protein [Candidatus Binatia bacterium]|nr:ABC transporter ATP-binding protein [Candidatus Binatia bacterium]
MVRLDRVVKTYRSGRTDLHALDGVTLDIAAGEFLSIVGPSGSGKSTLLHLVGGLDAPDSGEVLVGGRSLAEMSDDELTLLRRRRVGLVFQFFNLLPTMTAEENVGLPLLLDGTPASERRERVERALRKVLIWDRRHHTPDAMSGGEMQRVAIARALVIEPAVLLADEPTGNLDSRTGHEILELLRTTASRERQTVLMVTHDASAAEYGDRIITLVDGRIANERRTGRTLAEAAS